MASTVRYQEVEAGTELPPRSYEVNRVDLVKYAGASGDFNPIHWNERFATSVGLPDVIAHGMYTMGQVGRFLADWAGDPGAVEECGVRFSAPVVVPDETGATIDVSGVVEEKLDGNRVRVGVTAHAGESRVLTRARAVLRLG